MTDRLATKFKPSLVTSDGHFSGYGAVFGNVDSHRDVIERGAFEASLSKWRTKGRWPPMRLQHGDNGPNPFRFDNLPVGMWIDMREDVHGLHVEGRLLALNTDVGKRLLALMTAGVLDGLSIGFRPVKTRQGTGRVSRYLSEIDLRELSIVDEPSNDLARVVELSPYDAAAERLREAIANVAAPTAAKSSTDPIFARLKSALARLDAEGC